MWKINSQSSWFTYAKMFYTVWMSTTYLSKLSIYWLWDLPRSWFLRHQANVILASCRWYPKFRIFPLFSFSGFFIAHSRYGPYNINYEWTRSGRVRDESVSALLWSFGVILISRNSRFLHWYICSNKNVLSNSLWYNVSDLRVFSFTRCHLLIIGLPWS